VSLPLACLFYQSLVCYEHRCDDDDHGSGSGSGRIIEVAVAMVVVVVVVVVVFKKLDDFTS